MDDSVRLDLLKQEIKVLIHSTISKGHSFAFPDLESMTVDDLTAVKRELRDMLRTIGSDR